MLKAAASKTLFLKLVFSLGLAFWGSPGFAGEVKLSNSGKCHPLESPYYERTKNYQGFPSLEECLDSGGELPRGVSLPGADPVNKKVQ